LFLYLYTQWFIDAQRGKREEEVATPCTPSKDFEKFGHKNAKKFAKQTFRP
jgi:hypothetical protein